MSNAYIIHVRHLAKVFIVSPPSSSGLLLWMKRNELKRG